MVLNSRLKGTYHVPGHAKLPSLDHKTCQNTNKFWKATVTPGTDVIAAVNTHAADDLCAWVKVLVHSVAEAKQLLTLGLHTLKETCQYNNRLVTA